MTPTYEQMLEGSTTWKFEHRGIGYILSHHSYREGKQYEDWYSEPHPGTWCYYLVVSESQYPDSWVDFRNTDGGYGLVAGKAWDGVDFYGGISWNSDEPYYNRGYKRVVEAVKVGCDYNHSWDRDSGYYHSFDMVKQDAINTIEDLLRQYPTERVRCAWTGEWVSPKDTYTAINGVIVSRAAELPEGYDLWKEETNI